MGNDTRTVVLRRPGVCQLSAETVTVEPGRDRDGRASVSRWRVPGSRGMTSLCHALPPGVTWPAGAVRPETFEQAGAGPRRRGPCARCRVYDAEERLSRCGPRHCEGRRSGVCALPARNAGTRPQTHSGRGYRSRPTRSAGAERRSSTYASSASTSSLALSVDALKGLSHP
jgi:hypothetical protein